MRTAIDTNVISAIWSKERGWEGAVDALSRSRRAGGLVIAGVTYAELLAYPGATEDFLKAFLADFRIEADFACSAELWREAGYRFRGYSQRRRNARLEGEPKRMLADFVIGAHALLRADRLVTLDRRRYKRDFSELVLVCIDSDASCC